MSRLSQQIQQVHRTGLGMAGAGSASFILGGQIAGTRPDLLLIYPEGKNIRAPDECPFLQIGESKYGKFMLELAVHAQPGFEAAVKLASSSTVSTARANLSGGPPYDLAIYRNGSLEVVEHRIASGSEYLAHLQKTWVDQMIAAVDQLPPVPPDLLGS